ncbi:MAG: DNA alkylation repair protein [Muribaculaceae bacterium]|nr:DNA alkylation repair protein [Muribaculaceae bacterium]
MIENKNEGILNEIKKEFFIFRNGIVADKLKGLYPSGVIVYGLNVPQLKEISIRYGKDLELGKRLWEDKKSRESRLLALYILPPEDLEEQYAEKMIRDVRNDEEAELLAFRLLRHLPYAERLLVKLQNAEKFDNTKSAYCVNMLAKNLGL